MSDSNQSYRTIRRTTSCPECGGTTFIEDYGRGEVVCGKCGLVVKENVMNSGPEWRAFTREEKNARSRVGTPTSYSVHDKGLSTVIDRINRDAFGRQLPTSTKIQMLRLRKWQIRSRVHSSIDRNLAQAMAELDRLADKIHVPDTVKEKGALIYRRALDKGLVRGRSISAIVAASLYAACRFTETPRTLRETAEAGLIKKKDVARCYRLLIYELDIKMPIANPIRNIPKIASKVNISEKTQQRAIQVIKIAKKNRAVSGKDPMGMAAAALYIACVLEGERKTQKDLAESAGVTEVTVRNRYRGLREVLGLDV